MCKEIIDITGVMDGWMDDSGCFFFAVVFAVFCWVIHERIHSIYDTMEHKIQRIQSSFGLFHL